MSEKETRTIRAGTIRISREALDEILVSGEAAKPLEACGLLVGRHDDGGSLITLAVETRNAHPTPETHFEIDPQTLIKAYRDERTGGPSVIGYFHSHPTGEPTPSETDQAQAPRDGRIWAIVSDQEVRFWKDMPSGFERVPFEVTDP